jgi:hypothetical protein
MVMLLEFGSHSVGQSSRLQILKAVDGFMEPSVEGFLQDTSTLWVPRKVSLSSTARSFKGFLPLVCPYFMLCQIASFC